MRFLVLGLVVAFADLCLSNIDTNCKCWTPYYRRTTCPGGTDLGPDECNAAGCCYLASDRYKCYAAAEKCTIPQCRVPLGGRRPCRKVENRLLLPRSTCEAVGCCYGEGFEPRCYEPLEDIINPTQSPIDYRTKDPKAKKPYLFRKLDYVGDNNKMMAECPKEGRRRCGPYYTTRSRCKAFGCCWDPKDKSSPTCFHANRFLVKVDKNEVDLIILVDGSSSVGALNFALLKEWMKSFASLMDVKKGKVQVGVVKYSSTFTTEVRLGAITDNTLLNAAIDGISFVGGSRRTAEAITQTVLVDLMNPVKTRYTARRYILLVTAGPSDNPGLLGSASNFANSRMVDVFGLGVGLSQPLHELQLVARSPSRVFSADFATLSAQNQNILAAMRI